jgi:hypothetical protein
MQSSSPTSSKKTMEEDTQERILTSPHEYIRDSLHSKYENCISCGSRTEYTCIKCGYCYSCHWKREQLEQIEQRDSLKDFYVSISKKISNDINQAKKQDSTSVQGSEKWGTLDVLGQPAEPICTYYRCHHKFSLHDTRSCRCKHPMNKTLGIFVRYD